MKSILVLTVLAFQLCSGRNEILMNREGSVDRSRLQRFNGSINLRDNGLGCHSPSAPWGVAWHVGSGIMKNPNLFLIWDYGGALIFDGLIQVNRTMNIDYSPMIYKLLDDFKINKDSYAYQMLHNIPLPIGGTIGDQIGLFPIAYLNRIMNVGCSSPYTNQTDLHIVATVIDYLLRWPKHLPDGTISREDGWLGEQGKGASFVWADDQYMGLVLLARWASFTNNESIASFVTEQALLFNKHLQDPVDGLYFHGYNDASGKHSCCKWGRANGWAILSNTEVLKMLQNFPSLSEMKSKMIKILISQTEGLLRYQSTDGRFRQVIDKSNSFLETSSTALIVAAWARSVRHGWLDSHEGHHLHNAIFRAWSSLTKQVKQDGTVDGICVGTGIQPDVQAYEERPCIYSMSADGGLGALLTAAAEMSDLISQNRID